MGDVKVLTLGSLRSVSIIGAGGEAGWVKRIVHPDNVNTKLMSMGITEVNPGYSPHRWHNHIRYKDEASELVYPKGFEEFYYVLSGSGVVQWKTKDGKIDEEKVAAGDTIFFPRGVPEHQVLNNSPEKLAVIWCGSPIVVRNDMK